MFFPDFHRRSDCGSDADELAKNVNNLVKTLASDPTLADDLSNVKSFIKTFNNYDAESSTDVAKLACDATSK